MGMSPLRVAEEEEESLLFSGLLTDPESLPTSNTIKNTQSVHDLVCDPVASNGGGNWLRNKR